MNGVFLDVDTVGDDIDLQPLLQCLPFWQWRHTDSPTSICEVVSNTHVIVTNKVVLSAEVFAQCNNLKLVCVAATGTNNVDITAATDCGIIVCNVRDYATASVVQHVFATLLALVTKLQNYRTEVLRGEWSRSRNFTLLREPIMELHGMTLGIIGYGTLGQAVAAVARAFGMQVLIANRIGQSTVDSGRIHWEELLRTADVVSLHCPLNAQTQNLLNRESIGKMKRGSILINTARGSIVEANALLDALKEGHLGGAVIDVLEIEPPPANHPLVQATMPNLIVTPHIAWASREARQRLINEVAENIMAFFRNEPRNVVAHDNG